MTPNTYGMASSRHHLHNNEITSALDSDDFAANVNMVIKSSMGSLGRDLAYS
jgi:hypothetical protein